MADEREPGYFDTADTYPERRTTRRGRRFLAIAVAVVAFGGFAGLIYYAYSKGREAGSSSVAPIIRAGDGPTKVRPEQPGGMQVPNQDKEVYGRVSPNQNSGARVENLLPPPEQPLPRTVLRQMPEPPTGHILGPATAPPMPPPPPIANLNPPPAPEPAPPSAAAPAASPPPPAPPAATRSPPPPPPARAAAPPPAAPTPQPAAQTAAVSPAAGTPAARGYRVQLVALRSEQLALAEWEKLKKANPDLFNGLSPNVVRADLGEKGIYYRLQAGPLAGAAQASDLCEKAKSRKLGCIVVRP
jgi:hypothetical protein